MISLYYYFLADFDSTLFLYTSKYWCDTLVRKCHLYKMDIYFNGSFWFASFFFYVLKMCFQLWLWNLCHHNELFMRYMCPINIEAGDGEKTSSNKTWNMQFSVFSLFENNNTLFTKIQSAIIDLIYFSFPKQMHPFNRATLLSTFSGKWFLVMTSISYRISSYIFFLVLVSSCQEMQRKKNTENLWITLSIIWQVLYCKYEIPFWFDSGPSQKWYALLSIGRTVQSSSLNSWPG